jgi:hypothetical protein|tara:strand:+ start:133 stop:531 length:399 start_codon:yes stop_codon:yes gene_type:complete
MQLQITGRPENPLKEMFTRIIWQSQQLPVPAPQGRSLAERVTRKVTPLSISDGRSIVVDGQDATIPPGVSNRCDGAAIKALAGVYHSRVLFIQEGSQWRRVADGEVVTMSKKQTYRTEAQPVFRSAPRLSID